MSDPVTNLDIEDVLSSIRRLVEDGDWQRQEAERLKAETAAADPAEVAEEVEDLPERFVLTPSLRVTSRGADAPESEPEPDQMEEVEALRVDQPDDHPEDTSDPEEHAAQPPEAAPELEAEIAESPDTPELGQSAETNYRDIDFSDIDWDADPEQDTVTEDDTQVVAAQAEEADAEQVDAADAGQPETDAEETLSPQHRLMATVAELEAAVGGQADEWEPDGSEEEQPVWTSAPQETRFREGEEAQPYVQPDEPEVMFQHVGPDHVSEEQLSDLAEDLGGDTNPDMAPGGGHAFAGEMDEDLDAFVADSNVIDEETLRRIVAEIVREELQGTLGERITRNVRKLVRREIYRALASQEFE
ncbi:hypothetical protein [Marivivens marinus]|uniref:hypothetical protein n=1 Tax=Marivivens marinus TaxID=3110173 RepID=UPI003B8498F9